jgi:hypothetical protein
VSQFRKQHGRNRQQKTVMSNTLPPICVMLDSVLTDDMWCMMMHENDV